MEYVKFYGLDEEPFRNDPDRRFYFEGRAPSEARMRLLRGVRQCKGMSILVGGPGRGKTTLARHLLDQLDGEERSVRLLAIPHAACDAGWLLPRIAASFGVAQPAATPMQLLGQIFERLASLKAAGTHPVLLVDEAQMLRNRDVMEEFRGLLNLEHNGVKLLSLVLFGLPDLSDVLRLDAPLAQRVDIRVQLGTFDEADTAEYVKHRLSCVGGAPTLFTDDAVALLHDCTDGIPRLINTLADNALFEGYLARAETVNEEIVRASAEQLEMLPTATEPEPDSAPEEAAAGLQNPFAVAAPVAPAAPAVQTPAPPVPDMGWVQPRSAEATASQPMMAAPVPPMVEPPTVLSPPVPPAPAAPATPRVGERAANAWESPIVDDDTHGEMQFGADGIEVELDRPIDGPSEVEVELDAATPPLQTIDVLDEEEREETLSGLVEDMDQHWDNAAEPEAPKQPVRAEITPALETSVDPEGDSHSELVDTLFDEITVED